MAGETRYYELDLSTGEVARVTSFSSEASTWRADTGGSGEFRELHAATRNNWLVLRRSTRSDWIRGYVSGLQASSNFVWSDDSGFWVSKIRTVT